VTRAAPGVTLSGSFRHKEAWLFRDLTLRLEPGRWTCLLGPSGVGKSTLLRLLAALDTGGQFDGRIETDDAAPLSGRIAYMAQADLLPPWLSIESGLLLGARLRGDAPERERAQQLLGRVGLSAHSRKRPAKLSGGQRQRAALARMLMEDRPLALLDEPFSALDAGTRAAMQELAFDTLAGRTVLLVTHDPAEALRLGHRVLLFIDGGLEEIAVPARAPLRPFDDPDYLRAQAQLLKRLKPQADDGTRHAAA